MLKLAVFVSGRGSNLNAILESISSKKISAQVEAVISNKIECPAFDIALKNNIPTYSVSQTAKDGYISYDDLASKLDELGVKLIVLAGFLKKIPDEFVDRYKNKIINIHPALLPSFGGKGMYGHHVHEAVFNRSCQVSGATVHFVDNVYDNGKIIAQRCVDISGVKSPVEIADRVLKIEHELLPYVIGKFSDDKIMIDNNRVTILN